MRVILIIKLSKKYILSTPGTFNKRFTVLKDSPAFTHSAPAKTSIFKIQFLEITEVLGPVIPALLLIHIELSVLQVSCRKLRED